MDVKSHVYKNNKVYNFLLFFNRVHVKVQMLLIRHKVEMKMKMALLLLFLCRYFWKESGSFCLGVYNSIPGPAHIFYLTLQHHHEGEVLIITSTIITCRPSQLSV